MRPGTVQNDHTLDSITQDRHHVRLNSAHKCRYAWIDRVRIAGIVRAHGTHLGPSDVWKDLSV